MNWTLAAEKYTGKDELLARITSIEDLCEAQAEQRDNMNPSYGYWTALKLDSMGSYQLGHLASNTVNIAEGLLDRTELDRCYVINRSEMKLLSKDCDSLQGVLLSHDYDGKHTLSSSQQKNIHVFTRT